MGLLNGFKKLKRYIANDHGDYQLVSLWTHASTVVMDGDVTLRDSLNSKLDKSGGTITGNITTESSNAGNLTLKDTGLELDTSNNNGVDADRFKVLEAIDNNGQRYGVFQFAARADGGTDVSMTATNMKSNGETWAGGIWAMAKKDGSMHYIVTQPDKFKNALLLSDIGRRYTATKSVAITSTDIDTDAEGASITLPKGTYMVMGQWCFETVLPITTTRVTKCKIYNKTTSVNTAEQRICQGAGNFCVVQSTALVVLSAENTLCVKGAATQTSVAGTTSITAIKISD